VDDIADSGVGTVAERREALDCWRTDLDALYHGNAPRRTAFLVEAVRRYGLRQADFLAVVDGMEMDVVGDGRAPDLRTLDLYCDRVASAVGRLSVKIFGMEDGPGFELAHHLGRALQLTNILRDLDEDASLDRLYLPREFLSDAGLQTRDPMAAISDPAIDVTCRKVAVLAHQHYREADRVMRTRPRGHIKTPRLMSAVYAAILREMEKAGWAPPRHRARLGKARLIRIVLANRLFG
jgi:phytoene synthase